MFAALLLSAAPLIPIPCPAGQETDMARYRVALDTPTGELPFLVEFEGQQAFVLNGAERIPVADAHRNESGFMLGFPHYDSQLVARLPEGETDRMTGTWTKVRGADQVAEVTLTASAVPAAGGSPRFTPDPSEDTPEQPGRWTVDFESSTTPAVAILEFGSDDASGGRPVTGTVLTHVGDYRYLAGRLDGDRLRLSCFDGAHAFLFDATVDTEGGLTGTFQSGDWWSESFTARADPEAKLPDPFQQVQPLSGGSLFDLVGLDLEGKEQSILDLGLAGSPFIVQVFGSWCPNCHDEAAFLSRLSKRYAERGIGFLGLAFELTRETERDLEQVKRFSERYGLDYPLLLMGTADKVAAAETLGLLDAVLSFPTTLFVDARGKIRAVHSGFSGPATGPEHELLAAEFDRRQEELLAEVPPRGPKLPLGVAEWNEWGGAGRGVRFSIADGVLVARFIRDPESEGTVTTVELDGPRLVLGGRSYFLDRESRAFLDPLDMGRRLTPRGETRAPSVWSWGDRPEEILAHAEATDGRATRELVLALVPQLSAAAEAGAEALERGRQSPVPAVRMATAWALGEAGANVHTPWILEQLRSNHAPLRRESAAALIRLLPDLDEATAQTVRAALAEAAATDPLPSLAAAMELEPSASNPR